ncbi:DUF4153 domain-containing protein [Streptococcus merionis]|uniref:DUF4153 domain-containing protein n=1 Tax=Streptococcus merionis TaxID=400065 RepID=UPI0026ED7284|nr:DUF4153 domain-containing protein [Streptococcus merionis]
MTLSKSVVTAPIDAVAKKKPLFSFTLTQRQAKALKLAVPLVFLWAYHYIASFIFDRRWMGVVLISALLLLIEHLATVFELPWSKVTASIEAKVFLGLCLAQGLAVSLWGFYEQLAFFQFAFLHASVLVYTLARSNWFGQGKLGTFLLHDLTSIGLATPTRYLSIPFRIFRFKEGHDSLDDSTHAQQTPFILLALAISAVLITFVFSQLQIVSSAFAGFTSHFWQGLGRIGNYLSSLELGTTISITATALPIALWSYCMITGSLIERPKSDSYSNFLSRIHSLKVFPKAAVYIILGSLCGVYALFFVVGATELSELLSLNTISAPTASTVAVSGFWQLIRVSLLNFAVLSGLYLYAKTDLWTDKRSRQLLGLLFTFASLFTLLAGWKLFGVYIYLYGLTPLRLVSGWFVTVLLVWCSLTLWRLHKPIDAVRFGLFYLFASFAVICYLYPIFL